MSEEAKLNFKFNFVLGDSKWSKRIAALKIDQLTAVRVSGVQTIATAAEAIAMGDVTVAGLSYFRNLDEDNNILIGFDDGGFIDFLELEPGEFAFMRLSVNAPYAISLVAACELEYCIFQRNP